MTPHLAAFMLAAVFSAPGATARAVQLCTRVLQLQPRAHPAWACQFADELDYWAGETGGDPRLALAVAMQESSLRMDAVSPTGDVSLFQFSPGTVRQYQMDRKLLKRDRAYSIRMHYLVMRDKRRMCPGPKGWSCYHSVTPVHRKRYEHLVGRYL
jgi:soluble lytic murein transglycosylase-like protein